RYHSRSTPGFSCFSPAMAIRCGSPQGNRRGLSLDDVTTDPWLLVLEPPRVALIKVFRFRQSASEMRASILAHLQKETLSELSDVHIVQDPCDFKPSMPPFVSAFLLHFWARDRER